MFFSHGIHGNLSLRDGFCPQISQISRIFIAARWFYLPQITQITRIFPFLIRFFALQKSLYGFAQILSLRDGFSRCSSGTRTLRCSRFCYLVFFSLIFFLTECTEIYRCEMFFYSRKARLHQWENGIMAWAAWVRWVMSCWGLLSSESSKWCSVSHCFILRSSMAGWSAG